MGAEVDGMEDLRPLPQAQRTWRWHAFAALWVAMGANAGLYSFGGSLLSLGLRPLEVVACVAVGLVVTTAALVLNSVPGVAYGIPFPVYARASFGLEGAKYAALTRGVVAVFWLSFQMWLGADSLYQGLVRAAPGFGAWAPLWPPYLTGGQLICLALVTLLHLGLVAAGVRHFDKLSYLISPLALTLFLFIALWALTPAWGGVGLERVLELEIGGQAAGGAGPLAWATAVNATVSIWSTLMLNMADLARLAPRQKDQVLGQLAGVPLPQLAALAVGVLGASAAQAKSGTACWLINDLFAYWPAWAAVLAGVLILGTQVAVNLGANIIPPANDFVNLSPERLRWRWCAYGTVVLAPLACPFYLFHSPKGFALRFLGGYGMVTGAIYGVMVTDYYAVRGGRLSLRDLYPEKPGEGACAYWRGHNWRAAAAVLAGLALPLPAWAADLCGLPRAGFWAACEQTSWFIACLVAAAAYALLCLASPPPAMRPEAEEGGC